MHTIRGVVGLLVLAALSVGATCRRDPHGWTTAPPSPAQNRQFDLHAAGTDYNGSLLSPSWVGLAGGGLPGETEPCKRNPSSAGCTSQSPRLDEAGFPNVLICMFEVASRVKGHINWALASSVGEVLWLNFATDGDYNFMFFPDGDRGLTANNGSSEGVTDPARQFIELEFDSRETVSHFGTTWWTDFDEVVQRHRRGEEVQKALNPKAPIVAARAVVYGLFGLDCEHNCQSEFHPVYALAIEVDDSEKNNQWAIFVRNWGNEGFCSRFDHHLTLPEQKLRLVLPRRGTKPRVNRDLTTFASTRKEIPFPEVAFDTTSGDPGQIVLTFTLPSADQRVDGDMLLTLEWPSSAPASRQMRYTEPARRGAAMPRESAAAQGAESSEEYLERLLTSRQLSPAAARASARGAAAPARNVRVDPPNPVPIEDFKRPTSPPPTRAARVKLSAEKQQNDNALIDEICRAWAGERLPTFNNRDVSALCQGRK